MEAAREREQARQAEAEPDAQARRAELERCDEAKRLRGAAERAKAARKS